MESIAILLSLPTRFVEAHETTIKDRIREILSDNKDKSVVSILVDTFKPHIVQNFKKSKGVKTYTEIIP